MGKVLEFKARSNAPEPTPAEVPANAPETPPSGSLAELVSSHHPEVPPVLSGHCMGLTPRQLEYMLSALAFYAKNGWDEGQKAKQAFAAIDYDGGVVLNKGAGK